MDLKEFPQAKPVDNANIEITVGDLHANPMRLLFILLKENIFAFNLDHSNYRSSVKKKIKNKSPDEIYQKLWNTVHRDPDLKNHPLLKIGKKDFKDKLVDRESAKELRKSFKKISKQLTKKDLKFFEEVIKNLVVVSSPKLLRLIGDEMCDRAGNDKFMEVIFKKLHRHFPFEILESNHGAQFKMVLQEGLGNFISKPEDIYYFQNQLKNTRAFYDTSVSSGDQSLSLQNLGSLIETGLVDEKEITSSLRQVYLPHVKLISYSLLESGDIRVFSHAPIGFETLRGLADGLGVFYKDQTAKELANTIDEINERFSNFIPQVNLREFMQLGLDLTAKFKNQYPKKYAAKDEDKLNKIAYYYYRILWNRDQPSRELTNNKDYTTEWWHGHDKSNDLTNIPHSMTLDSGLGKEYSYWNQQWKVDIRSLDAQFKPVNVFAIKDVNEGKMSQGSYLLLRDDAKALILAGKKK